MNGGSVWVCAGRCGVIETFAVVSGRAEAPVPGSHPGRAARNGYGLAFAEMASLGDIGQWITEHESLLSGMAAMIALAGYVRAARGDAPDAFSLGVEPYWPLARASDRA